MKPKNGGDGWGRCSKRTVVGRTTRNTRAPPPSGGIRLCTADAPLAPAPAGLERKLNISILWAMNGDGPALLHAAAAAALLLSAAMLLLQLLSAVGCCCRLLLSPLSELSVLSDRSTSLPQSACTVYY